MPAFVRPVNARLTEMLIVRFGFDFLVRDYGEHPLS